MPAVERRPSSACILEGPAPSGGDTAGLRLEDLQDMLVGPAHKNWKG